MNPYVSHLKKGILTAQNAINSYVSYPKMEITTPVCPINHYVSIPKRKYLVAFPVTIHHIWIYK